MVQQQQTVQVVEDAKESAETAHGLRKIGGKTSNACDSIGSQVCAGSSGRWNRNGCLQMTRVSVADFLARMQVRRTESKSGNDVGGRSLYVIQRLRRGKGGEGNMDWRKVLPRRKW